MDFEWKPSAEIVFRCISTFIGQWNICDTVNENNKCWCTESLSEFSTKKDLLFILTTPLGLSRPIAENTNNPLYLQFFLHHRCSSSSLRGIHSIHSPSPPFDPKPHKANRKKRREKSAEKEEKENDDGKRWRSGRHELRHCLNATGQDPLNQYHFKSGAQNKIRA